MTDNNRIPDEWHNTYSYNCLTLEEFKILQEMHRIGDSFPFGGCDECDEYILGDYRRCPCGNRRCYFIHGTYEGKDYFYVEVS